MRPNKNIRQYLVNRVRLMLDKPVVLTTLSLLVIFLMLLFKSPVTDAACSPPATTYGTDTMSVSVPSTTTYTIYVRMQAPSASSNSIMLQVDGGECYNVGGSSSMTTGAWTWLDYQNGNTSSVMSQSLSAGTHSLELIGTEPGVEIDSVLLEANGNCVPQDLGTNCTTSQPVPTAPTLTGSSSSPTSVNLSWTASTDTEGPGLGGYYVMRNGVNITPNGVTGTSYTDNSVSPNSSYAYTVLAYDTAPTPGESPASNTVNITTAPLTCSSPPSVPTGVSGSALSPTSLTVTWNASTVTAPCAVTQYTVYMTNSSGGNPTNGQTATTNSLSVKGLNQNTTYYFTVTATDSNGTSAASAVGSVTTQAETTAPSTPGNPVDVAVNSSEVDLSWTASTDAVSVDYYRVFRSTSSGSVPSSPIYTTPDNSTLSYKDTTVSPNTSYYYWVEAVNEALIPSAAAEFEPFPVTTPIVVSTSPPSAPSNLISPLIVGNPISVELSWGASTPSTGNTISSYQVWRSTGSAAAVEVTSVTGTSYTDTTVAPFTKYTYYVVAVDSSANKSADSNTLTVMTPPGENSISYCLDGGSTVDFGDVTTVVGHWGQTPDPNYNYDSSNIVDFGDVASVVGGWGEVC